MKCILVLVVLFAGITTYFLVPRDVEKSPSAEIKTPERASPSTAASEAEVHRFCGMCHAYPPASLFPKSLWPAEVRRGFDFFHSSRYDGPSPDMDSVVEYYRRDAPEKLPPAQRCPLASSSLPVASEPLSWNPPDTNTPGCTNVHLARLFSKDKLDLLVCQTDPGRVWAVKPYVDPPSWHLLSEVVAPAHAEVVDLDGDGNLDVIVADLGSRFPSDSKTGRVVWLRNDGHGKFNPVILLEGVGRVADVQVADFNGDGRLDLVLAEFGWQQGSVLLLENQTVDWARPVFRRVTLDERSGAIHVPVADIDGDGHLDVVALFSQEHETIVAFLGDGNGGFTRKTIYRAPHPAYGSSGIQLVDLNGDGKLDVLYTNGDSLDPPPLLRPYHGVQWLENRGDFPFVHHQITAQYGVMSARAVDIDGDGNLDIVAVAWLPKPLWAEAKKENAESVQILRQVSKGKFERHVLATGEWRHMTCDVGDLFGDGRVHLVAGNFMMDQSKGNLITVWKNIGIPK